MKKPRTRDRLIQNAIDLFYEKGFVKGSIRDLVRSVNLTNAVFYNYFKSKDHLLYEIMERMNEEYFRRMNHVLSKNEDPFDRLREMVFQHTCLTAERKKGVKIFFEGGYQLSPTFKAKILHEQKNMYNLFKKQISDLEKKGLLRPVNKTVATFCCFAVMNWAWRWFKESGELSVEEVAENITDIFFNGILNSEKIHKSQKSLMKMGNRKNSERAI
jgi:AcrR family transcriptional regulator